MKYNMRESNSSKLFLGVIALFLVCVFFVSCGEGQRRVDIPEVIPYDQEDINQSDTISEPGTDAQPTDSDETNTIDETTQVGLNEYAVTESMTEPPFPKATPASQWRMFRRTPDNMALISADINLPLGKEWNNGVNPEYRQVSFGAPAANYIYGSPAIANGMLYFGVKLGYVQAHKFETTAYQWRLMEPLKGSITTSIAADDDRIYFGTSGGGKMFAYDQQSDTQIWSFQTGGNISAPPLAEEATRAPIIMSSPKIVGDRLYFGAFDGKMYCLNTEDGSVVWEFATAGKIYSSPAIASGRLYFANFDGDMFCLSADTGDEIWKITLPKPTSCSPVVFGPRVWIGCKNAKMYCLRAFNGETLWEYQAPDSDFGIETCPAIDEKNCYFGDTSGHFTCLNRKTGDEVWQSQVTDKPISSAPVLADGKIFFGSHDTHLYVLDKTTGETLDSFKANGSIIASPVIIGNEVIAPSYDAYVYILRGVNYN